MSLAVLCLVFFRCSTVVPAQPEEGVFYMADGYSRTVLELNEGKFRYWFSTDVSTGDPEPEYPLSGEYSVNSNRITLYSDQISSYAKQWTFRKIRGNITLWRNVAIDLYENDKRFDGYGIMGKTPREAEDVWLNPWTGSGR